MSKRAKRTRKAHNELVTRKELTKVLDCNLRTVAKYQDEGLPVAVRGRGGRPSLFDPKAATAWLEARNAGGHVKNQPVDLSIARTRREEAQARLTEQLLETRARRLLPVEDVEREWRAEVTAVRAKILASYTTHADQVHRAATLEGLAGVERALKALAYEVLRELADPSRVPDPSSGGHRQAA